MYVVFLGTKIPVAAVDVINLILTNLDNLMLEDGNNDKKEESEVKSNSEETKPDDEPKEDSEEKSESKDNEKLDESAEKTEEASEETKIEQDESETKVIFNVKI